MIYFHFAASGLVILLFFMLLLRNLRQAILAGLVFTTLTLGALPWQLMPLDGVALAAQTMFLVLAISWLFMRKDTALALSYIVNPYLLLLLVLGMVLVAFLLLSGNQTYGITMIAGYVIKGLLPVVALGCLAPFDEEDSRLIIVTIVCGALLMAIAILAWSGVQETERFGLGDEGSPITIARVIGLGATLLLLLAFLQPGIRLARFVLYALIGVFMLFVLGLTGSRGPLVAAVLSTLIGFLLLGAGTGRRLRTALALGLVAIFILSIVTLLPIEILDFPGIERIVDRFETFGQNPSDMTRISFFQTAWDGFLASSGLGVGTGGYATLRGIEGAAYPHNLVLEVAVGQGIIGLLILVAVLLVTGKQILQLSRNPDLDISSKILVALWFYSLFNALVSMDIAGNYSLWVTGGMLWFFERRAEMPQSQPSASESATQS